MKAEKHYVRGAAYGGGHLGASVGTTLGNESWRARQCPKCGVPPYERCRPVRVNPDSAYALLRLKAPHTERKRSRRRPSSVDSPHGTVFGAETVAAQGTPGVRSTT